MTIYEALAERELKKILREVKQDEDAIGRKVRLILVTARKDIIGELASDPSQWRAARLHELLDSVDHRIAMLRIELIAVADTAVELGLKRGVQLGLSMLPAGGVTSMVNVDSQLLRSLAEYRADLIKGVTDFTRDRITEIVRRNMISGKGLQNTIKEIGNILPDRGVFKTIARRAELIAQQEYGRLLSEAAQRGMEQSVDIIPGLEKEWRCLFRNSRDAHMAAHGQRVLVNEPFIVGGERLMYPRAPTGSAWNVIHCHCIAVPRLPDPQRNEPA